MRINENATGAVRLSGLKRSMESNLTSATRLWRPWSAQARWSTSSPRMSTGSTTKRVPPRSPTYTGALTGSGASSAGAPRPAPWSKSRCGPTTRVGSRSTPPGQSSAPTGTPSSGGRPITPASCCPPVRTAPRPGGATGFSNRTWCFSATTSPRRRWRSASPTRTSATPSSSSARASRSTRPTASCFGWRANRTRAERSRGRRGRRANCPTAKNRSACSTSGPPEQNAAACRPF
mmetsp:Transcript_48823/g.110796  ORF Transcript_48823/g.110796 Transcript_48823/m.110796 type:complete len:234 (-) Transcript_48823:250-951(-)